MGGSTRLENDYHTVIKIRGIPALSVEQIGMMTGALNAYADLHYSSDDASLTVTSVTTAEDGWGAVTSAAETVMRVCRKAFGDDYLPQAVNASADKLPPYRVPANERKHPKWKK